MTSTSTDELPRLGRYQVLSKLAQGGMAEIFLAKALGVMGFERLVAIKLIHSQLTRDGDFVKMFIDEARIAMHLSHRNIVQVFDLDKTGDTYFIAMEYVHGVNLYDVYERIASKGRWLDLPLALYIVAEVCKGLNFAHTRIGPDGRPLGIVHRDISPQNVLLSFEGEVKITDFGIAKAAERLHQTTPGIVKGKYAYMAPEILKEKGVDGRADVFAAGVLLYELLVGENPYAGATPVATIENVLNKKVPPPSARGAMVSRELDDIAMQALSKDPDTRYQTAADLAEALTEHGLNLTSLRRDVASGDATVATLLAELFPEKLKRNTTATPGGVKIPMAEKDDAFRDTHPPAKPAIVNTDNQTTDPAQQEQLDSTLLNFDQAPKIGGNRRDMYNSDEEPSTALDLDPQQLYDLDRTEGMQAVSTKRRGKRGDDASTAKSLPSVGAEDTRPPVVLDPSEEEPGFEPTMMHANQRQAGRGGRGAPMVVPSDPAGSRSAEQQLVVPVQSRSGPGLSPIPMPGFQPAPMGFPQPGLLAPQQQPPSIQPRPANRNFTLAGIALALVAISVVVTILVSRSAGPTMIAMPIVSHPTGAEVLINGEKQANVTPIEAMLPSGKTHKIELRLRGHKTIVQDILPMEGVTPSIDVTLAPLRGTILFQVQPPDARVLINGAQRGTVATRLTGLEPGQDLILRLEREGYKPYQQVVTLSEQVPEFTVTKQLEKE